MSKYRELVVSEIMDKMGTQNRNKAEDVLDVISDYIAINETGLCLLTLPNKYKCSFLTPILRIYVTREHNRPAILVSNRAEEFARVFYYED